MTPQVWALLAVALALTLLATACWWLARAVQDLTDQLGHDHDVRWHQEEQ